MTGQTPEWVKSIHKGMLGDLTIREMAEFMEYTMRRRGMSETRIAECIGRWYGSLVRGRLELAEHMERNDLR